MREGQENKIPFFSHVESEVYEGNPRIALIKLLPIKIDHICSSSNRALFINASGYSLSCFVCS